jgi:hypothetical protein
MADDDLSNLDPNRSVGDSVQGCPPSSRAPVVRTKSWIGIVLVDEDGTGINDETFEVEVPDGSIVRGQTGFGICQPGQQDEADGRALIEGIDPGTCKITFPKLDTDAWKPA